MFSYAPYVSRKRRPSYTENAQFMLTGRFKLTLLLLLMR